MAPPNVYDDIVTKATDENLTSENWELILNICDKVADEGETGARNVIASVLRRLTHRNPNVQLYALTLAESLSKNCGLPINREISSRSFTSGLEKLIADRTTHEKVRKRTLSLIATWTGEFESDPQLGIMEECYNGLRAKNYSFEPAQEPPPPQVDDEIRRREEEELQRVLEMSMHDKGGRSQWQSYNGAASSSGPGASSTAGASGVVSSSSSRPQQQQSYAAAPSSSYAPAGSPSPGPQAIVTSSPVRSNTMPPTSPSQPAPVSRVRALFAFEPTDKGELAFEKGDIIKVVDRNYKDWWRGQLRGRTGIFPVNYVEPLPEQSPADIAKEAEQEATLFSQAASIDKLLGMLRGLDPMKDNLADNEEIQELYRSSMALRPKIVKLIDKYNQKRTELVMMNESFIKARTIFDRMMEESLARHTGYYDGRPNYGPPVQGGPGPDARPPMDYRQSVYNNAGPTPYGGMQAPGPGPQQYPQPYGDPSYPQGYSQQQPQHGYPTQATPAPYSQPIQTAADPRPFSTQPQAQPYVQPQPQPQQPQPHPQQPLPQTQQQQPQQLPDQSQPQTQPQQITQGPPYVYDPNATYSDPNVQAWAEYYSKGGTDLTGAVYFISIPGIKEAPIQPASAPATVSQQPQGYYAGQQPAQQTPTQQYPGNAGVDPNASVSSLPVQSQQPAQTPGSPTNHQGFSAGYAPGQDQVYGQPQQHPQYSPEPYPANAPSSAPATGYFPQSQPQQTPQQLPNGNPSLHRMNSLSGIPDGAHDQSQSSLAGALGPAPSSPTISGSTPAFAQMQGQFSSMSLGHGMPQGQQGPPQAPHQQYATPTPQLA